MISMLIFGIEELTKDNRILLCLESLTTGCPPGMGFKYTLAPG